jgi:predicted RNase H-like HicB family nuclease
MRFAGRLFKSGRYWAVEIPILDIVTQGRTRPDALRMIADAVEALSARKRLRIKIYPGRDGEFEIGSSDDGALAALLLRRIRTRSGMTLMEAAARLGSKSPNAYARYEQGRAIPSVKKLSELYAAVGLTADWVLSESRD